MTLLWIYLIGTIITTAVIAIFCACDPMIRAGLKKVQIDKVLIGAVFWPIFWVFTIFTIFFVRRN